MAWAQKNPYFFISPPKAYFFPPCPTSPSRKIFLTTDLARFSVIESYSFRRYYLMDSLAINCHLLGYNIHISLLTLSFLHPLMTRFFQFLFYSLLIRWCNCTLHTIIYDLGRHIAVGPWDFFVFSVQGGPGTRVCQHVVGLVVECNSNCIMISCYKL